MIKENSHIFTDAHCKVCSAVLISESQKLAHYQSKKHANKVRRYMAIHGEEEVCSSKKIKLDTKQEGSSEEDRNKCCPICNMTFSSPVVANSHYLGKTHAKNLKLKQQPPKAEGTEELSPGAVLKSPGAVPAQKQPANLPATTVPSNEENQNTSNPDKFCSLCHATFNNPLMAKQHYVGKKHKKQETKLKLMAHYGRSPDEPAASTVYQEEYLLQHGTRSSCTHERRQRALMATAILAKTSREEAPALFLDCRWPKSEHRISTHYGFIVPLAE
ncbi:finger 346 isoform X1 [Podarcis lilfordi]|uniref:Zinc finger protein 346 n=1 Tax=Podarcis lilfordi TaxID=74358 RepID=A0AA35NZ55_9SAUR|nr:finger 346 isoform X1 [Podarcis lilfordi]